ncbi:MAG: iron donor protein CyaY [Gallionella sp.]
MNESEFNLLADTVFVQIETLIDRCNVDYTRSGNIMEIEFDNGQKIIINRHDINQEIWVAAKSGGFHYARQNDTWLSRRDGSELYEKLKELFALQGEEVVL